MIVVFILILAGALWGAGLWVFARAEMALRRKVAWGGFLVTTGICIGAVLPRADLWIRFLWVMAVLPLVAAVDVFLYRSSRGWTYWVRACGFEVVTVFAAAAGARYVLDAAGIEALVGRPID